MVRTARMLLCLIAVLGIAGLLVHASAQSVSACMSADAAAAVTSVSADHGEGAHDHGSHTLPESHCHLTQAALPVGPTVGRPDERALSEQQPGNLPRLVQRRYRIDRPPRA